MRSEWTCLGSQVVKSPDESHMQRLIPDWQGVVYNVCLRMLGRPADADDATQEVFRHVLTRPEAYDQARAFKPWICRVARNVVLNRLRAEKTRAAKTEVYEQRAAAVAKEDPVDRKERETVVQGQLEGLPADERFLLTLHYYGGLNKTEMAEVLDVPRTTIQTRMASAWRWCMNPLAVSAVGGNRVPQEPSTEPEY